MTQIGFFGTSFMLDGDRLASRSGIYSGTNSDPTRPDNVLAATVDCEELG
jgi:hypothetical protein